jgi:chromosome partitioning protein
MLLALGGLKGGTGKTTLAAGLAAAAHLQGARVLLLDTTRSGDLAYWTQSSPGLPFACVHLPQPDAADPAKLCGLSLGYDLTVIDCDPLPGAVQEAISSAADLVLLPVGASAMDVWSAAEAQTLWGPMTSRVVCNGHDPRTRLGARLHADLARSGLPLLTATVPRRAIHAEAMAYGSCAPLDTPESPASLELSALLQELRTAAFKAQSSALRVH